MQIRPTALTTGLIIHSFIALFYVYTEFGIDSREMTVFQFIQLHNLRYDANVVGKVLKKHDYEVIQKRVDGERKRIIRLPYKYYQGNN